MTILRRAALLAFCGLLSACATGPAPQVPGEPAKSAALRNMEQVAMAAHRCWFASNDAAFRDFSFANELNSFSGQPRFLLVPRADYGGRPLLVVQAQGPAGAVNSFGPLLDRPLGLRIRADLARWAAGSSDCVTPA